MPSNRNRDTLSCMTRAYSVRIPDDRKTAADRKASELGMTFSDAVNVALDTWTGRPDPAAARKETLRAQALEAELAALRAQIAGLAGLEAAPVAKTIPGSGKADRLAAALRAATECPISKKELAETTGYSPGHIKKTLSILEELGVVARPAWGKYHAVPGADLEAALREARTRLAREKAGYRQAEPADAVNGEEEESPAEPRPAPRKPPAAATRERVARVRETVAAKGLPPVVTASELAASPAVPVFKAGPDVDCLHEGLRGKGVCPECKQWVVRKP